MGDMPFKWAGAASDGETWELTVETDRFSDDDPFVVALGMDTENAAGTEKGYGIAMLSPAEVREVAVRLIEHARNVDFNNNRPDVVTARLGRKEVT